MSDYLIKATGCHGQVRAYAARTTDMVEEARLRHDAWPTAAAALGRTLTATTMMAAMLKGMEKLTVKIEGDGPIGALIADADARGHARAYLQNPHVHFELNDQGKLDVARAVGKNGTLSVVKDLGLKHHFTGSVPIISGELGEDFAYYYTHSEQIPSAVGLGVLVNPDRSILAAGGFIVQMMPGANEKTVSALEEKIAEMESISKLIENGKTPEEMIAVLLGDTMKIVERKNIQFQCHCSRHEDGIKY